MSNPSTLLEKITFTSLRGKNTIVHYTPLGYSITNSDVVIKFRRVYESKKSNKLKWDSVLQKLKAALGCKPQKTKDTVMYRKKKDLWVLHISDLPVSPDMVAKLDKIEEYIITNDIRKVKMRTLRNKV